MAALLLAALVSTTTTLASPPLAEEPTTPEPITTTLVAPVTGDQTPKKANTELRTALLVRAGFPAPMSAEALVRMDHVVAIGVEYGLLPTTSVSGVDVRYHAIAGDARIFPLGGAFYFGMRAGIQHVDASATVDAGAYGTVSGSMSADTYFINPRLGFLWTYSSGLAIGVDAGVQIPLNHNQASTVPKGVTPPAELSSAIQTLGNSVLPTVSLIQLGMMF
ncbi:MAG: hypothetical protein ACHREM_32570 [Polyangiales bacterium]